MRATSAQLRVVPTVQEREQGEKKIDLLDLTGIRIRLQSIEGWSTERCERIEPQYKAFLKLHLYHHSKNLLPTQDIDDMWHAHILHTRKYVTFCDEVFGAYLHHNPHAIDEPDTENRQKQFFYTKRLLIETLRESGLDLNGTIEASICDGGAYCDGD